MLVSIFWFLIPVMLMRMAPGIISVMHVLFHILPTVQPVIPRTLRTNPAVLVIIIHFTTFSALYQHSVIPQSYVLSSAFPGYFFSKADIRNPLLLLAHERSKTHVARYHRISSCSAFLSLSISSITASLAG